MGVFNDEVVSERNQRPSFNGRTVLRAYFMRDGQYVPLANTQVSSVMLFRKIANTSPNSLLEASSGLVRDSVAADAVWRWTLAGWEDYQNGVPGATVPDFLQVSDYTTDIGPSTSSIFEVDDGRLAVILDGTIDGSSVLRDGVTRIAATTQLSGEPAAEYIDVWTVKLCAGCEWQTFISDTSFFQNNAVLLTTPLLFSTRERLYNKRIEVGSIEKLKIGTELTVENKDIDDSIKNVLKDGLITSGTVQIIRYNESDQSRPAWEPIHIFNEAGMVVEVTSDNTFLYTFNTTNESPGTYSVQVEYTILDETRRSPLMYFTLV
jgi:hypothetical protein